MTLEIKPLLVKQLREKTGAGMMNCKKALQEANGDFEQATLLLRQKGLSSADKKSSRKVAEGLVSSYIHTGGKIGVLVEVNCETDFVARRIEFYELIKNIAMQIAASPQVKYISVDLIPEEVLQAEKEIESNKIDLKNKSANIKEKIVLGRVKKTLSEMTLLDQPFVKDPNITIEELIKEKIALLGENIIIKRFICYKIGQE